MLFINKYKVNFYISDKNSQSVYHLTFGRSFNSKERKKEKEREKLCKCPSGEEYMYIHFEKIFCLFLFF